MKLEIVEGADETAVLEDESDVGERTVLADAAPPHETSDETTRGSALVKVQGPDTGGKR
jgi:hypothetical protein